LIKNRKRFIEKELMLHKYKIKKKKKMEMKENASLLRLNRWNSMNKFITPLELKYFLLIVQIILKKH